MDLTYASFNIFNKLNFYNSVEEHVDNRVVRLASEAKHLKQIEQLFITYNLFFIFNTLLSLTTSFQVDKTINYRNAVDKGEGLVDDLIGKSFSQIKFHRADRAMPIK